MSIKQKYSKEIRDIRNEIDKVRKGEIYEISKYGGHGYTTTRANAIEEALDHLLDLIENNLPNARQTLNEAVRIAKEKNK